MTVDKVIAKIIWLTFLAHPVHLCRLFQSCIFSRSQSAYKCESVPRMFRNGQILLPFSFLVTDFTHVAASGAEGLTMFPTCIVCFVHVLSTLSATNGSLQAGLLLSHK